LHVKPGIYFTDDPAFNGKRRELVAQDYVYSIKRQYDPRWKSPNLYLIEPYIAGMEAIREQALKTGKFDYDTEVDGLRALDRYTFRIKLTQVNYTFQYLLAQCQVSCALAREVVDAAPDKVMEHPVGTGPYMLDEWQRSSKITFVANPGYRDVYYTASPPADDPVMQADYAKLKGRKLPLTPRVEISIINEEQPRWLAFLNDEQDMLERLAAEFANVAIPNNKLAPNLARRGIKMDRNPGVEVTFTYYAMQNPMIGGYTPEKVALRRAISLGYSNEEEIRIIRRNQAIPAQSPVGPGAAGYDPKLRTSASEYDPAKARALLDTYGYVDRDGDGYRELPDGRPFTFDRASTPTQLDKQFDELWKKDMDAIGIRFTAHKAQWPELLKQSKAGQLMSWGLGWSVATPDADAFYDVLYGPNAGQSNHSRFDLPEWNRLFAASKKLRDGPERDALYQKMNKLFIAYQPWKLGVHRVITDLMQPWVYGYHRHPVSRSWWSYVYVDGNQQQKALHP
jgi:ABC-type transport system substrate-binding protein